jgi:hypothetical protein
VHNDVFAGKSFAAHTVGIEHLKANFVISVGLQVDDASCKHVRTDYIEADILQCALALKPEKRHSRVECPFADLAVLDLHVRIPIFVSFDAPFEAEAR